MTWRRELNRAAQRLREFLRRGAGGIGERRQDRRIEQRPLHGVLRPDHEVGAGRLAGLGDHRLAIPDRQFALRVAGPDPAGEDDDQRPLRLDLDQELGALHRRVDERRVDGERPRMPAEEVGGAVQQPDQQRLIVAGNVQPSVLVEPDVRLPGDRDRGAAAVGDVDDIAGTERVIERRPTKDTGRVLHLSFALHRRARRRSAARTPPVPLTTSASPRRDMPLVIRKRTIISAARAPSGHNPSPSLIRTLLRPQFRPGALQLRIAIPQRRPCDNSQVDDLYSAFSS